MLNDCREWFAEQGMLQQKVPHFQPRQQQQILAEAIQKTMRDGPDLAAEAGTGTGKTLSYLAPIFASDLTERKVVISTGTKVLQDQLVYRDIPMLERALGRRIDVHIMKGRKSYLCERRFAQAIRQPHLFSSNAAKTLDHISAWKAHTQTGDRDEIRANLNVDSIWNELSVSSDQCLGRSCEFYGSCWVTLMRQRAQTAQIIVVNHHLYFADAAMRRASPQASGRIIPDHNVVIFDEAHEIEDIACEAFGVTLSDYRINDFDQDVLNLTMREGIENQFHPLRLDLQDAVKASFSASHIAQRKTYFPDKLSEDTQKNALRLSGSLRVLADMLSAYDFQEAMPLMQRARKLADDCDFLFGTQNPEEISNESPFAFYSETSQRSKTLCARPVNPTPYLKQAFANAQCVFLSATLSVGGTLNHFSESMGLEKPNTLILDSPFNYAEHALLYVPHDMPRPDHPQFFELACREIEAIIEASGGGVFLLCTSRSAVEAYAKHFAPMLGERLFVQQGNGSSAQLVEDFRQHGNAILIATKGLWKGVDVQGPALRGVIIDKLPFSPPDDPITEARIAHIKQQGGNAFREFQLPQAILALKQGVGRLIRSEADKGVITVLDRRIIEGNYSKKFLQSLPPAKLTSDREEALEMLREITRKLTPTASSRDAQTSL